MFNLFNSNSRIEELQKFVESAKSVNPLVRDWRQVRAEFNIRAISAVIGSDFVEKDGKYVIDGNMSAISSEEYDALMSSIVYFEMMVEQPAIDVPVSARVPRDIINKLSGECTADEIKETIPYFLSKYAMCGDFAILALAVRRMCAKRRNRRIKIAVGIIGLMAGAYVGYRAYDAFKHRNDDDINQVSALEGEVVAAGIE